MISLISTFEYNYHFWGKLTYKLCEKSTFSARTERHELKRNCQYFETRTAACDEKYFQQV
jgi:hypothetical protein